ncbi:MAG: hypothetical protein HYY44_01785 [Deltaproteobacteria bacterium]|nr:hypothetical protein [Deltaproteobacteria bacterium]
MNTTKLTLSIPKDLLEEAKIYSRKARQPLSRLVSRYFSLLSRRGKTQEASSGITSKVKKVTGLSRSEKTEKEILFDALSHKYR